MGAWKSTLFGIFFITNIAIVPKATRSPHNDGADLTAWTAGVEFGEGFETGKNWPTTLPLFNYIQDHSYADTIGAKDCW